MAVTPPAGGSSREVARRRRQIERSLLMTTAEEAGYKAFLQAARGAERLCLGYDVGRDDRPTFAVVSHDAVGGMTVLHVGPATKRLRPAVRINARRCGRTTAAKLVADALAAMNAGVSQVSASKPTAIGKSWPSTYGQPLPVSSPRADDDRRQPTQEHPQ
jgi:hypothetical protein